MLHTAFISRAEFLIRDEQIELRIGVGVPYTDRLSQSASAFIGLIQDGEYTLLTALISTQIIPSYQIYLGYPVLPFTEKCVS